MNPIRPSYRVTGQLPLDSEVYIGEGIVRIAEYAPYPKALDIAIAAERRRLRREALRRLIQRKIRKAAYWAFVTGIFLTALLVRLWG